MQRSLRPRVIGIIAIVFATLGVLVSAERFGVPRYGGLAAVLAIGAYGVFVLHLVSAVKLVRYRPNSHRWVIGYAVFAFAIRILDVVVVLTTPSAPASRPSDGIVVGHMIESAASAFGALVTAAIAVLALGWTITYLTLAVTSRSRRACAGASNGYPTLPLDGLQAVPIQ